MYQEVAVVPKPVGHNGSSLTMRAPEFDLVEAHESAEPPWLLRTNPPAKVHLDDARNMVEEAPALP